jgi:protein-disulfide isomerase
MPSEKPPSSPPRGRGLFVAVLVLCVLGLLVAAELTHVHVKAHLNPTVRSFCAFSETVNCDSVARQVDYSVFLGVPVSVWGMLGYVVMALTSVWGMRAKRPAAATGLLAVLTFVSTVVSLTLGSVSAFVIRSVCILCLGTYVINTALLLLGIILARRAGVRASVSAAWEEAARNSHRTFSWGGATGLAVIALLLFYPQYWAEPAHASAPPKLAPSASDALLEGMATGKTSDGHFWIGAREPQLVIEEFSDYECPFCGRSHWLLRGWVKANPDRIRLVHRHFPLDQACNPIVRQPFHPRACAFAALAACAGENGKFWEANDYLFQHSHDQGPFKVSRMAAAIGVDESALKGCLESRAAQLLEGDLREGLSLKITGTPTFRINGKVYTGELPAELLAKFKAPPGAPSAAPE